MSGTTLSRPARSGPAAAGSPVALAAITTATAVNGRRRSCWKRSDRYNKAGTIQNSSASADVTGTEAARFSVGGLVGFNEQGTIRNVSASGKVTGTTSVGGLVGTSTGNSSGVIKNALASGSVTGDDAVGGLVRDNDGTIQQTIAVGPVSGGSDVSGLVGKNTRTDGTGTIEDSYFDEQATGQSTSAGSATGLTTAQMTRQDARTNMPGLDFENTWTTTESYPQLRALSDAGESTSDDDTAEQGSVVDTYDDNADGGISISELSRAAIDFARDELTIDQLSTVAAAYAG